ncbi:MAG: 4Fe-4S dicluster domain-containing protein [Thermodesulfobacteriota bacterium]
MAESPPPIDLNRLSPGRLKSRMFSQDTCMACGLCAGSCPVAGVDGFDPRKLVRMASLGLMDELVEARWPWICTMCAKCGHVCPRDINIADLVRSIRSLRARDEVPGILHKGLTTALKTGNNLGIPAEDFVFILEDVAEEIAAEPGFEDFTVSIDQSGSNILTTIHNKLVNTHTEDLKHWWKIFHAAGESWTVPSENWEGCSWGYFTGDDEALKIMAGRICGHMHRLEAKNLLWCE